MTTGVQPANQQCLVRDVGVSISLALNCTWVSDPNIVISMEGGGFLRSSLPSPPPSVGEGDAQNNHLLPRPRVTALRPGSQKQSALIDYVDNKLLHISRKYQKRHSQQSQDEQGPDEDVQGYLAFGSMARDLEALLDVVWMSGTRMHPLRLFSKILRVMTVG